MKRPLAVGLAACLLLLVARPVLAQEDTGADPTAGTGGFGSGSTSSDAPATFNMRASALPVDVAISAPTALPLDVGAGLAYSGVSVNSQPLIVSEAAPVYVPLLGALGLLGGPSALFGIVAGLGPALVVGVPTLFGLPPLPVDPTLLPLAQILAPAAGLPVPTPPALGCFSYYPGEPHEASCGGPIQNVLGFEGKGASAATKSEGDPEDPASLRSESSAAVLGIDPAEGNTLAPFSAGLARSAASARIVEGRAEAGAATSVSDIEIAGVLRIPSLDTSVAAALDGTKDRAEVEERRCSLAGATIGGIPIEFRPDGFVIADQATLPVPLGAATQLVNRLLEQASIVIGAGPADPGVLQITPYPGETSTLAPDGTEFTTQFGCLEIRYRIPVSGTDVKITLGKIAMRMGAFAAEPFDDSGFSAGDTGESESTDLGGSIDTATGSTDLGGDPIDTSLSGSVGGDPPSPPEPGAGAPRPSSESFETSSSPISTATWGFDGGWLAPYALLALAIPILAKARRFSFGGSR
ncbi:MAG TPA: hypothetical protein VFV35_05825 [Acidimicrobiales bacterium]|nr:hypothetical protein [Acidimicrobiales bacterium]